MTTDVFSENAKNIRRKKRMTTDVFPESEKISVGKRTWLRIISGKVKFLEVNAACLCFIARYKSCPNPYVRMKMYLEMFREKWKVMHVHCSFEPEK